MVAISQTQAVNERGDEKVVCFLLVPDFSMLAFTAAIEPLRAANELSGGGLFRWVVASSDGQPVVCSNGMKITPDIEIGQIDDCWAITVCGGRNSHLSRDRAVEAWLRRHALKRTKIGAISDGTYVLARAGLIDGYRCTIHWNCIDGFAETYPDIEVNDKIYQIDSNRFTCSGGTASMDLMLKLIENEHGRSLAVAVAEHFMHVDIREGQADQRMPLGAHHEFRNENLTKALELMEDHLEETLAIGELSEMVGVSARQMERLFATYFDRTPSQYYRELRLRRARHLLTSSHLSITEIGIACGFSSMSHFSKCYRTFYGVPPRRERKRESREKQDA